MGQAWCTATEYSDIAKYINANPSQNKYQNMHSRAVRQKNKKRVLHHLNAMALENNAKGFFIHGYICGPNVEIRYKIYPNGSIDVRKHKFHNIVDAYNYLDKVKKEILKKVVQGYLTGSQHRKTTTGQFYLQRDKNPRATLASGNAVSKNELSQDFVNWIIAREFIIVEGH